MEWINLKSTEYHIFKSLHLWTSLLVSDWWYKKVGDFFFSLKLSQWKKFFLISIAGVWFNLSGVKKLWCFWWVGGKASKQIPLHTVLQVCIYIVRGYMYIRESGSGFQVCTSISISWASPFLLMHYHCDIWERKPRRRSLNGSCDAL